MTDITLVHPLATTVEDITAINAYLNVQLQPPVGDGWITLPELVAEGSPWREELLARICSRYTTTDRHFAAMSFFGAAIWQAVVAGIATYLTTNRVLELKPANLALHWDAQGWADTLALVDGRFVALPDDPAADHADVTVVADRDALRARLIDYIVRDYVPPLINLVSAASPLGKRTLWGAVTDRCIGTIIWLAPQLNMTSVCRAEVNAFLHDWPLKSRTGFVTVEHDSREQLFLERSSCCLSYKVLEHAYCLTCPLIPLEERTQGLRTYMANEAPA